jgi:RecJ-like exonuclease
MNEIKNLEIDIKKITEKFLKESENKEIIIISHFNTDGIASATIMLQTLKKLDRKFSVKIVKNIKKEFISKLPKNKIFIFLDLNSSNIDHILNEKLENTFIIYQDKINISIPKGIDIINPELVNKQKTSNSNLTYLFCKEINKGIEKFAKLVILGIIENSSNIGYLNKDI